VVQETLGENQRETDEEAKKRDSQAQVFSILKWRAGTTEYLPARGLTVKNFQIQQPQIP
jgi:hypothetical protein